MSQAIRDAETAAYSAMMSTAPLRDSVDMRNALIVVVSANIEKHTLEMCLRTVKGGDGFCEEFTCSEKKQLAADEKAIAELISQQEKARAERRAEFTEKATKFLCDATLVKKMPNSISTTSANGVWGDHPNISDYPALEKKTAKMSVGYERTSERTSNGKGILSIKPIANRQKDSWNGRKGDLICTSDFTDGQKKTLEERRDAFIIWENKGYKGCRRFFAGIENECREHSDEKKCNCVPVVCAYSHNPNDLTQNWESKYVSGIGNILFPTWRSHFAVTVSEDTKEVLKYFMLKNDHWVLSSYDEVREHIIQIDLNSSQRFLQDLMSDPSFK